MPPIRPYFLPVFLLLLTGCASLRTDKSHYAGTDTMLAKADYATALARVEAAKDTAYGYNNRVVYYLDAGMLHHWKGDYEKSNELLELAERGIEENFTKSLTRSASSLILNDNLLTYAGEDYEDVYLNAFKALNYLALGRTDEAFVEVRRIDQKLLQLEGKHEKIARKLDEAEEAHQPFRPGKSLFAESALGRYLGAMLYRNEGKWDDVRIDLERIERGWQLQPAIHPYDPPDLSRIAEPLKPPLARLNLIAFSGLPPDKKARTFYIHTEENLVVLAGSAENYLGRQSLDGLTAIPWPDMPAGYHFKFQLPYMQKRPSKVGRIEVELAGMWVENLQKLESLENAATETFAAKMPVIYLKTVTRAVAKGLASEQAKQQVTQDMGEGLSFITRLATDLMVDQTENADLRLSRFFAAEVAVQELHLEAGIYDIRINYYAHDGALLHRDTRNGVAIEPGRLNLIESAYLN